jgi:hypothetical protein
MAMTPRGLTVSQQQGLSDGRAASQASAWSDVSKLGEALTAGYPTPALAESPVGDYLQAGMYVISGQ